LPRNGCSILLGEGWVYHSIAVFIRTFRTFFANFRESPECELGLFGFTIDSPLLKEGSCVQERIRQAVDEALKHGPPVVSSPGAQWIKDPEKGWDKFPPLHYVSKYCEPYLKKYYPRWRRSHVSREATYTYLRKRTMGRKATPADMADFASERELVGRYVLDVYREFISWALERGILPPPYKYGAITAFFRECGYQVPEGALHSEPLRRR
jgi:hypothetical protein